MRIKAMVRTLRRRSLDRLSRAALNPEEEQGLFDRALRVFHLSTEITALENPASIPTRVVEALVQDVGFPVASIVLEDPDTGQLAYAAERGVPPEVKAMGFRKGGISLRVFESGQPHFVEDMGQDPAANPKARPFFQAYACLPIRSHDRTFGLIFVNYGKPHRFTAAERDILGTFANQTAIALENARLRRAERRRSAALAALANLGRDLTRSLDPGDLLRVLERTLREQFPHLRAGIFWAQEEGGLHPRLQFGLAEPAAQLPLPPASPLSALAGRACLESVPARTLLEGLGPQNLPDLEAWEGLALPLRTPDGPEGLIGLFFPAQPVLGEAERDFLRTLGDRAALALHNARLYASTRRAAERDGLTQLLNHATFMAQLEAALEETTLRAQPLALIMLDADHFKGFNDHFGHAFGDRVLVAMAATLRAQVRQADGLGRLGGEEFAVFLPGADLETATQVAERIRTAMSVLVLDGPDGSRIAAPTVSQGVALFSPGTGKTELLLRADEALYRAKAEGRNRTCVATTSRAPFPQEEPESASIA